MNYMEDKNKQSILKAILTILFGLAFIVVSAWIFGVVSKEPVPTPTREVVVCSPNFLAYQDLSDEGGQTVSLIGARQSMFAEDGKFVNSLIVLTKSEMETSKVACGYLFVRAGTVKKGALRSWEDVVIDPNGFGGHLNPESAISVNDGEQDSSYLYSLDRVQYWPTHNRQSLQTADWAVLLNVQSEVPFLIALNTEDKTGFIDEISIVYKCWNPKDGKENNECKLSIESKVDTLTDTLE